MKKLLLTAAAIALGAGAGLADHHATPIATKADVKVTITGNDAMQYDKKEITVKAGQVVALTFKNIGKLPVEAMGHNVVILKSGTDVTQFAMASMTQKANGFIPKEKKWTDAIIANTKILGPGQSETIVFKAPAAGTYDYVCTFPGHFGVMRGKLLVK